MLAPADGGPGHARRWWGAGFGFDELRPLMIEVLDSPELQTGYLVS